jgi:hypothetical protein
MDIWAGDDMVSDENVLDFYEALGFEEIDIEDGLTALSFEIDPQGSYALITNAEGAIPETLKQAVVFACYSPEGAFLWSASFKHSYVFKDIWAGNKSTEQKLDAIRKRRENIDYYK